MPIPNRRFRPLQPPLPVLHPVLRGTLAGLLGAFVLASLCLPLGCQESPSAGGPAAARPLTVGVAFETLQTEFWVTALEAFRQELDRRQIKMIQAIADGDSSRQLEQVKTFITRKVDGIILVPKDSKTCIPMIKAANAADIPIVLFNRPADKSDARSVAMVADNQSLTQATVEYMIQQLKESGAKAQAMILIGDLGDINAIGRHDGSGGCQAGSRGRRRRGPCADRME